MLLPPQSRPGPDRYARPVRDSIADYQVLRPWGPAGRYVCRPPDRLGREGEVLVTELAVDAEGWQALCDQLIRLAGAAGPGLLELIEVGPDRVTGRAFVVTETARSGMDEASGARQEADRLAALEQAARAAHGLHEVGLAHGRIHPGALLLTGRGPVLDLPRLDGPPGEVVRIGSWRELSCIDPDLLAGEGPSRASDIWALGATLHAALSDRSLYPGIESDEPVTAVQRVMFTRPETDPALPSGLRALVGACLAADPADRPPTALALAEKLAAAEVGS